MNGRRRVRVEVRGAVQGVGFRPFVYRLATSLGLAGWVINDAGGVCLEVEGSPELVDAFVERLPREAPALAVIQGVDISPLSPRGERGFRIRHSEGGDGVMRALVLPDVATCEACLAELWDPGDRRHRYPFTNCTDCGPRFSIITALPYDRPNTTMRRFPMCSDCLAEYEDPQNRRFHAQPNACPRCGPTLAFYTPAGDPSHAPAHPDFPPTRGTCALVALGEEALALAVRALRAGRIVAVKGLGGFHLMVDARNAPGVARLRARKPRREKPFALMVADVAQARLLCELSPEEEALLTSPQAPIVLARRREGALVAENVAPGMPELGIMVPYTPLHHVLLRELGFPVVATSGNRTGEPICTDEWEALERLGDVADAFLVHNRPIARHVDDSVARVVGGVPRLLRRARGYAPFPVMLSRRVPAILAVGGHLKNTVALGLGRQVFISQHIGDLETLEARVAFERAVTDLLRLYRATPVAVAHDMHPDYASTLWAQEAVGGRLPQADPVLSALEGCALVSVQHHHAHMAACLAEHGIEGSALGVTWDGTGYGPDGMVWGGEFLAGCVREARRVATLRPFRLPGGDAAVMAPKRVAFALLWELWGEGALARDDVPAVRALRSGEGEMLAHMVRRGVNAPLTTSVGRLFDGVAALLGLCQEVSFEGQAAMALEFAAAGAASVAAGYPLGPWELAALPDEPGVLCWDWREMVAALLDDLRRGVDRSIMAARFHHTLAEWVVRVAEAVGEPRVVLTGGVFQNTLLAELVSRRLAEIGIPVFQHRHVPPNDGGLSLGQVAVAAARLGETEA